MATHSSILLGKSHGWRGHEESDTTEQLPFAFPEEEHGLETQRLEVCALGRSQLVEALGSLQLTWRGRREKRVRLKTRTPSRQRWWRLKEKPEEETERKKEKEETGVRKQRGGRVLGGVAVSSEAVPLRWEKRRPAAVCRVLCLLAGGGLHKAEPVAGLTVEKEKVLIRVALPN